MGNPGIVSHKLSLLKMSRYIGKSDRFPSDPNIIQIDFMSQSDNRLAG
jgi:hypothetical protein